MISIIVPVYNVEKYLDECIQSILNQTFTDWECILVNDGSKDKSGLICDKWAEEDTRIRVIHQINQGVSTARNQGIQQAKGEYITFIDSDDWIDCKYLESLVIPAKENNTDLCVSGLIKNYSNGNTSLSQPAYNNSFTLNKDNLNQFIDLNKKFLLYGPTAKLYKKGTIDNFHIEFPTDIYFGEDLIFNYQYLEHVNSISCIDKAYYHYRIIGTGTLSSKLREDQFETNYMQWKILKSFYERRDLWYNEAKNLLYHRLWGIIYDGLFIFPKLKDANKEYIKEILAIPEIKELKPYQHIYPCKNWIKFAILSRQTFIFYLFFKFNTK